MMVRTGFRYVSVFFSLLFLALPLLIESGVQCGRDVRAQKERLQTLEAQYAAGEIAPVAEASIFDGDLSAALERNVRFDRLSYIATHNSYQTHSVSAWVRVCHAISRVLPGKMPDGTGTLDHETLTDQLNGGIRSFELDVEAASQFGKPHFYCMHSPVIDMTTSCYDFALALREVRLWSENNPGHLPITIIMEPKLRFVPMGSLRFFSLDYANALDAFLREHLGDTLLEPAEMLRDYKTFADMRRADDWLPVRDMLGRVLVLFHYDWSDGGDILNAYMRQDETFRTQAMFPLHVDSTLPNACFLAYNEPETVQGMRNALWDAHFVVRTRTDAHPSYSAERRDLAFACGAQILSTDYPQKSGQASDVYAVSFACGRTVRMAPRG